MNIVALILSGGRGTRVDTQDKGLLNHHGKRLIQSVIDSLEPQVNQVIISHNRNAELYQQFNLPLVSDTDGQYQGPIAGILSVRGKSVPFDALLICPCDTPNIPPNLVALLSDNLLRGKSDIAVVFDGERQQNLHCLIDTSMLGSLEEFYSSGGRAIKNWFTKVKTSQVDFSAHKESFSNYNTLNSLNK